MPDAAATNQAEAPVTAQSAILLPEGAHGDPCEVPPFPEPLPEDSPLAGLPVQLDVTVPIPRFRVQDLLALEKGSILESRWIPGDDVPVWCGGVQLMWTEFELVDQKLAVRVTRLG